MNIMRPRILSTTIYEHPSPDARGNPAWLIHRFRRELKTTPARYRRSFKIES